MVKPNERVVKCECKAVKCSWVKCGEVLQCSDVHLVFFLPFCIWLYVLYTFV